MANSAEVTPVVPEITGPKGTESVRVHVASFWHRTAAALVDGLCIVPALVLLSYFTARIGGLPLPTTARFEAVLELFLEGGGVFYGFLAVGLIIILVYGFLFTVTTGATPGHRLLRLKVIDVYGEVPKWWWAATRSGGQLMAGLLLGLGFFWIAVDREKRGLHDWLAGTYVIRTSAGTQATARTAA